ncbi:MAG TPA: class I SAM-dependent methyltransferase [Firmicutes bacterium]|nr:class I SAM-dependent methyltransferase [Bacillota bacterium]
MSYGWIDPAKYSINCLLLLDDILIRVIAKYDDAEFRNQLGVVLAAHPAILWYFGESCPEYRAHFAALAAEAGPAGGEEERRRAEHYVLDALDWAVVYLYPEVMERLGYIADWQPEKLLEMADLRGKTVLDIGSGTGRLAFAAAPYAKVVYACEPVGRLRAYLREKKRRLGVQNLYIVDGTIAELPFPDDMFDVVMSGHVFGDDYEAEYREMMRVTKPGGYIIDCPGEDDRQKDGPDPEVLRLGFAYSHYKSGRGGDVYRYWKQKAGFAN